MGKLSNPHAKPTDLELEFEKAVNKVIAAIVKKGYNLALTKASLKENWAVQVVNTVEEDGTIGTLIYIPGVVMDQVFKNGTFK